VGEPRGERIGRLALQRRTGRTRYKPAPGCA